MVNFLLLVCVWIGVGLFAIPYLISGILLKVGYNIDPQKERKSNQRNYQSYSSELFEKVIFGIQLIPLIGLTYTKNFSASIFLYIIIIIIQIFMIAIFGQSGKCYSWVFKFKNKNMYIENTQKYKGDRIQLSNGKTNSNYNSNHIEKDRINKGGTYKRTDSSTISICKSIKEGYESLSNIKSVAEESLKNILISNGKSSNIVRVGLPIFSDIDAKKNQLITVVDNIINEEDAVLLFRSRSLPIVSGIASFLLDSKYNLFLEDSLEFMRNEIDLFLKELDNQINFHLEEVLKETTLVLFIKDIEDVYVIGIRIVRLTNKEIKNERKVIIKSIERAIKNCCNLSKEDSFLFYFTSYSSTISISAAKDIVQTYGKFEDLMYVNTEEGFCCFNIPKYYLVMNNEISKDELPIINEYIKDSIIDDKDFIGSESFIDCICTEDKKMSVKRYSLTDEENRSLMDFYNSNYNSLVIELKSTDFKPKKLIIFFKKIFEKEGIDGSSIGFCLGKQRTLNGRYALNVLTSKNIVSNLEDKIDYLGYLFSTRGGSIFEKFQLPDKITILYNLSKEGDVLDEEGRKFKEALLVPVNEINTKYFNIHDILSYEFLNEIYEDIFNEFLKGIGDDSDIIIGSAIQACKRKVENQCKLWRKYYGLDFLDYQKYILKDEVYEKINLQMEILQKIYDNKIKVKSECKINENLWRDLTSIAFPGVDWDREIFTLDFRKD